jgi:soluble lytic murein transglycosylase-like protein
MKLWKLSTLLIITLLWTGLARADEPPKIGHLTLPAPWWEITKDAAKKNNISPYWIAAVMAIESRFVRMAINHKYKCFGLMQLQKDVCRIMGVTDPFDSDQNIRAGAAILGRLERKCHGDKLRILKVYNPTDYDGSYSREVLKAWRQAKMGRE